MAFGHPAGCECTRCCDLDAMREQPVVYAALGVEYRREMARMNETERARNCGHTNRNPHTLVCPDCGDAESL